MPSNNQERFNALLPMPNDSVGDVRAELADLSANNALEPLHIGWAVEQLVESGVELPLVMATVFDFAPLEWLGKPELETPVDVDFDALAAMLGIDPISGKPAAKSRPTGNRVARAAAPLSNRVGVRANLGATFGSEGMRQRPLAGWSRSR